jgi:hypothetical protein
MEIFQLKKDESVKFSGAPYRARVLYWLLPDRNPLLRVLFFSICWLLAMFTSASTICNYLLGDDRTGRRANLRKIGDWAREMKQDQPNSNEYGQLIQICDMVERGECTVGQAMLAQQPAKQTIGAALAWVDRLPEEVLSAYLAIFATLSREDRMAAVSTTLFQCGGDNCLNTVWTVFDWPGHALFVEQLRLLSLEDRWTVLCSTQEERMSIVPVAGIFLPRDQQLTSLTLVAPNLAKVAEKQMSEEEFYGCIRGGWTSEDNPMQEFADLLGLHGAESLKKFVQKFFELKPMEWTDKPGKGYRVHPTTLATFNFFFQKLWEKHVPGEAYTELKFCQE